MKIGVSGILLWIEKIPLNIITLMSLHNLVVGLAIPQDESWWQWNLLPMRS